MTNYNPALNQHQVEAMPTMLPNLAADMDTTKPVQVWRELKPQKELVEFTLYYYTHNGYNGVQKKRVDFDVSLENLERQNYSPETCTVTYWGNVERYST